MTGIPERAVMRVFLFRLRRKSQHSVIDIQTCISVLTHALATEHRAQNRAVSAGNFSVKCGRFLYPSSGVCLFTQHSGSRTASRISCAKKNTLYFCILRRHRIQFPPITRRRNHRLPSPRLLMTRLGWICALFPLQSTSRV